MSLWWLRLFTDASCTRPLPAHAPSCQNVFVIKRVITRSKSSSTGFWSILTLHWATVIWVVSVSSMVVILVWIFLISVPIFSSSCSILSPARLFHSDGSNFQFILHRWFCFISWVGDGVLDGDSVSASLLRLIWFPEYDLQSGQYQSRDWCSPPQSKQ